MVKRVLFQNVGVGSAPPRDSSTQLIAPHVLERRRRIVIFIRPPNHKLGVNRTRGKLKEYNTRLSPKPAVGMIVNEEILKALKVGTGVPLWCSESRTWHCHSSGLGHRCGEGLTPCQGTSTCCGRGQKRKKKLRSETTEEEDKFDKKSSVV